MSDLDNNLKQYNDEQILALALAFEGKEESFKWLMANNSVEFAAVCDATLYKKETAQDWLTKNGYTTLSDFVSALGGDEDAYKKLSENPIKHWAAIVGASIYEEDSAMFWLLKSHLKAYAALADTLKKVYQQSSSGIGGIGSFGGGGGGLSSGGFSGFGGGSFGGGGASGMW